MNIKAKVNALINIGNTLVSLGNQIKTLLEDDNVEETKLQDVKPLKHYKVVDCEVSEVESINTKNDKLSRIIYSK